MERWESIEKYHQPKSTKNNMKTETKKQTNIPKPIAISILLVFSLWAFFAFHRVAVLLEHDVEISKVATSLTGIKYILGLSYSPEEIEWYIEFKQGLDKLNF